MNSSRRIANAARIASNEHETTTVNVYCKTTKNSFYRVIKTTATTTEERVAKAVSTATSTKERVAKAVSTASASKERVAKTVSTATSNKERVAKAVTVSTASASKERVAKTVSTASASKERVAKAVSTATSSKKRVAPTVRNVLLSTTHTLTASAIPTARSASQTHSQITSRQHVLSRQRPLPHTWCARSTRGHTRHAKATIHFRSRSYYYVMYDQLLWETTGRDVTVERLIV